MFMLLVWFEVQEREDVTLDADISEIELGFKFTANGEVIV